MSGRVYVTLADGRRVRGFRKTLRIQGARTPSHLMPAWHLSIVIPPTDMRFLGLRPGPFPGLVGVEIRDVSVEVVGKLRTFVLGQAVAFVRELVPDFRGVLAATLRRGDDPPRTLSGPSATFQPGTCEIRFDEGKAVVAMQRSSHVVNYEKSRAAARETRRAWPPL